MASRKAFPLRIDAQVYAAMECWAADELRSVNGQIEFLLRDALKRNGRLEGAGKGYEAAMEDNFSEGKE